ncbi:MAG: T9SS type A sorting domain-containing protein [Bacteroidota bacterium]|nr:T9SS type A sorting domain-containing protein [Bacteroidota bacterium]
MIKKLLSICFLALVVNSSNAQSFSLSYQYSAVTSTSGPIDPTPAPVATGITSGSWTAVGTGTNSSGGGYFSFTSWGTGATNANNTTFTGSIDLGRYYELTITPQVSYAVSLTNMSFGVSRSGTGIRHFAVRTNKDVYTNNIAATYTALGAAASASVPVVTVVSGNTFLWTDDAFNTGSGAAAFATNNICNVNFTGPNYTNQASPYTIRIYAWNAESGGGTFRVDTLVLNGSATFSIGVGLNKITHDLNAKIKLYPNPTADGFVNIDVPTTNYSKIEVVNILGAVVASQNNTLNEEKIKLDLATLPTGTYFVKVTAGEKSYTEKLIISK